MSDIRYCPLCNSELLKEGIYYRCPTLVDRVYSEYCISDNIPYPYYESCILSTKIRIYTDTDYYNIYSDWQSLKNCKIILKFPKGDIKKAVEKINKLIPFI